MKNIRRNAFIFDLFYDRLSKPEPVSERTPVFRNIHLSNVTGSGIKQIGYTKGIEEMPIDELSFSNMSMEAEKGFSAETTTNIRFYNVDFAVKEGASLYFKECKGVVLDDVRSRKPLSGQAIVEVEKAEDVRINNCFQMQLVDDYLKATDSRIFEGNNRLKTMDNRVLEHNN